MTYDYVCKSCEHTWEEEQGIKEDPITKCPKCGEEKAQRLISGGGGFILKGNGWFRTGY